MAYMPLALVAVHALFATPIKPMVQYPKQDAEVYMARLAQQNVLQSFYSGLGASQRRTLDRSIVTLDWLPMIVWVVSPELKQVSAARHAGGRGHGGPDAHARACVVEGASATDTRAIRPTRRC